MKNKKRKDGLKPFILSFILLGFLSSALFVLWMIWTPIAWYFQITKLFLPVLLFSGWFMTTGFFVHKYREAKVIKITLESDELVRFKYPIWFYMSKAYSIGQITKAVRTAAILNMSDGDVFLYLEDTIQE